VQDVFTRLDLPPAHESDAASLVDARVLGGDDDFHLTRLGFPGGEFLVSRTGHDTGQDVRLCVAARDVSLTLERQEGTSILNILEARVEEVTQEDEARMLVRLSVGPTPLLASITRKSAHDLELETGKTVYAQVKTVALL
jgi:molybdate transport system ATP-binding protein